jgi:hypothetical protein
MVSNTDMGFLAVTLALCKLRKQKKKRTRCWSKEWFKLRSRFTHENLLNVIRDTEPEDYKNFLRMDQEGFETLLELVRPKIEKQDTIMRKAIPASQRLSVTLRYLAFSMDLKYLKFMCAITPQTLEGIIMETSDAIIETLKDNVQVCMYLFHFLRLSSKK